MFLFVEETFDEIWGAIAAGPNKGTSTRPDQDQVRTIGPLPRHLDIDEDLSVSSRQTPVSTTSAGADDAGLGQAHERQLNCEHERNRPCRPSSPLHVRRPRHPNSPVRRIRGLQDADRHLSRNQHSDRRCNLDLYRTGSVRHVRACRLLSRAYADIDGQQHRAHREPILLRKRRRQDLLPAGHKHCRRTGAGHGILADCAQATAGRHHAAGDPGIRRLFRPRSQPSDRGGQHDAG